LSDANISGTLEARNFVAAPADKNESLDALGVLHDRNSQEEFISFTHFFLKGRQ
jgi:hypothetical protein